MAPQTALELVLKIVQINGWLGRLNGPLARFIKEEQPDFICMQEAFLPLAEGMKVFADQYNFLDEIRRASGLTHEFFGKNWGFNLGDSYYDEGNVILSRFPLTAQQAMHIHGEYHARNNNKAAIPNTRLWQAATATLPDGKTLALANYQGYLDGPHGIGTEVTVETMEKVSEKLAVLPRPLIFCGDLNFWPNSPALHTLDSLGLYNLTVEYRLKTTLSPAHRASDEDRGRAACDYIFVSPEIKVINFAASDALVSDHKALILEFDP